MPARIQTGTTERIEFAAENGSGTPLTGKTDIKLSIRRVSDGKFFDFSDLTFKAAGWTTRQQTMTEVDATNAAGDYYYSLNTATITNATADDTYMLRAEQSPKSDCANSPFTDELKVGQYVDKIDAAVSTRATQAQILSDATPFPGARIDAAITTRATQAQILSDATPFAGANIALIQAKTTNLPADPADESNQLAQHTATQAAITALNNLSQAGVQSAMTAQGYTAARAPNLDNLNATVSSRAVPGDAMDLVTDAVDAAALATSAITEIDSALSSAHGAGSWEGSTASVVATAVWNEALPGAYGAGSAGKIVGDDLDAKVSTRATQAQILSDATPFPGARVDAAISTRATPADVLTQLGTYGAATSAQVATRAAPGDAMDLITDAVDANALAASAVTEIDAALSLAHGAGSWGGSTASAVATAVWDEALPGAHGAGSAGKIVGDNINAAVSSRAAPGDAMDLVNNAVDSNSVATSGAQEIRNAILADSTAFNGADIPAILAAANAVNSRLPADPADESNQLAQHAVTQAAIAGLNDLGPSDVQAALTAQGYTIPRAGYLDRLDVAVSSRAAPGAAMALTLGAVDSSSVAASGANKIRDAILNDATRFAGADITAGAAAAVAMNVRLPADPADESNNMAQHAATQAAVAGLNDLSPVDVQSALTGQGYTAARAVKLDNLNATVSSRSSHTPADVDTLLTTNHGAGSWQGADAPTTAAAVWDLAKASHVAPGSFGEEVQSHATPAEVKTQADQALTDYDPPTRTEATADKAEVLAEVRKPVALLGVAFDTVANVFYAQASVTRAGAAVLPAELVSASLDVYDADDSLLFSVGDSAPDTLGVFRFAKSTPGFLADRAYFVRATVVLTSGTLTANKGFYTTT